MAYLLQEEVCPISEQLLFSLYDAAKRGLPVPVADVPPERRPSVALFCYRRSHLEGAALAVAAMCEEEDLNDVGGALRGQEAFAQQLELPILVACAPARRRRRGRGRGRRRTARGGCRGRSARYLKSRNHLAPFSKTAFG